MKKCGDKMNDMEENLLAVVEFLNTPLGGAELSILKTAFILGADICTTPKVLDVAICPGRHKIPIFILKRIIRRYMGERLKRYKKGYDFVLTQNSSAISAIRFARRTGAKSILFYRADMPELPKMIELADIVIASSEFIRRKYTPLRNDIKVLYPPVDLERFKSISKRTNEYISMVSPTPSKGGRIFADLARKMPDRKFLAVGRKLMKIRFPSNVEYVKWVDDMRDSYSHSSVVLIPSIWEEPFCRVAPEAQASGAPVISTKMGGLPESNAGQLFIDDPYDLEQWMQKIAEAETNREKYVEAGLKNASRFDEREYYRKLKDIMREHKNC